jgi:transposase
VQHRSSLKHRVHAQLMAFGHTCAVSDLFGVRGRELLERLEFPQPWRDNVLAAVALIDDLDHQIDAIQRELRALGADHRYIPLPLTVPGVGWVLGYTIASEIATSPDSRRRRSCAATAAYAPASTSPGAPIAAAGCPKHGPKYLRWALMEAATNAAKHPIYRARYQATKRRLGRQREAKVAQVDLARRLAEAIWHMLTPNQPFAPAGAVLPLAA